MGRGEEIRRRDREANAEKRGELEAEVIAEGLEAGDLRDVRGDCGWDRLVGFVRFVKGAKVECSEGRGTEGKGRGWGVD